jgi:hypothetical protein
LAREPSSDNIHPAAPFSTIEGLDVVPDGEGREDAFFLASKEDLSAIRVDFNSCNSPPTKKDRAENSSTSASEK